MTHRLRWGIPALLLVFGLLMAGCDIIGQSSVEAAFDDSLLAGSWSDGTTTLVFSGEKLTYTPGMPANLTLTYSLKPTAANVYTLTIFRKVNGDYVGTPDTGTFDYAPKTTFNGVSSPASITFSAVFANLAVIGTTQFDKL
jgi:hypothetical protein